MNSLHQPAQEDSESEEDSKIEKTINKKVYGDDISKYITEKDLRPMDDPRESPSRRGSVMSRVKKAKQRVLRKQIERGMSREDHVKEQMYTNQMLARVYQKMKENEDLFGDTSFDDVKEQMSLYRA